MKKNLLLVLASFFLFSCISEEGEGGISVVQGYVYKVLHDDDVFPIVITDTVISTTGADSIVLIVDTVLKTDTFPATKTDVYIVYGDEPIYGDKMETGYDGYYRFRYLTEGTYKVFAYSTLPNEVKVATIDTVAVAYGETKLVQNIYIHEGKSLDKSYVRGKVFVKYFDKDFYFTQAIPANEVRVYIRQKNAVYHFDEIRTGSDGVFVFQNLNPGDYEVFVLTEQAGYKILSPVIQPITIKEKGVIETIATPFTIIINA